MKCAEIMTKNPSCCLPTTPVEKVAQMMESEDVGPIPIVDDLQNKKLLGIVTDRDLTLKVTAKGRDPRQTQVREVMSNNLVTCQADEDLDRALKSMESAQVRRIPVVDNTQRLLGIITVSDIVSRLKDPAKTVEVTEQLSCCH